MNILFLTRRFYPEIGGVEKHVFEVARVLIEQGHRVTVITEGQSRKRIENYHLRHQSDTYSINSKEAVKSVQRLNYKDNQLSIIRINFGKENFFKKFKIWYKLLAHADEIINSDIIHCHDVFFWYLPFRFLFPTKKVYVTFHGYETKFPPTLKARIIRKISEKLSFGNICVGDFIKKWYGTKPDFVIYGGVGNKEIRNFKIDNRAKLKIKSPKLKILLVGRLEEDNGAKIYLEMLKKLNEIGVPYRLTVCGVGKYQRAFKEYGEAKGVVVNLKKYTDRADFIFASSYLSILEAIYQGKKVFAVYQNPLKRDYLKLSPFARFISISRSSDELVDKILKHLRNPDAVYKRDLDAQTWANTQTWGRVAGVYLKLWTS